MQGNLLSYKTVLNYFGKDTVKERYKYLYDKMKEYINDRCQQDELIVNENIPNQAVMDYFTDVYRLKEFHKIEYINKIKISAYEAFGILRRKPLQIQGRPSELLQSCKSGSCKSLTNKLFPCILNWLYT